MKAKPIKFHGLNQQDIQQIILLAFEKSWPPIDKGRTTLYKKIVDSGFEDKKQLSLCADVYFTEKFPSVFTFEIQSEGALSINRIHPVDNAIQIYRILADKWK